MSRGTRGQRPPGVVEHARCGGGDRGLEGVFAVVALLFVGVARDVRERPVRTSRRRKRSRSLPLGPTARLRMRVVSVVGTYPEVSPVVSQPVHGVNRPARRATSVAASRPFPLRAISSTRVGAQRRITSRSPTVRSMSRARRSSWTPFASRYRSVIHWGIAPRTRPTAMTCIPGDDGARAARIDALDLGAEVDLDAGYGRLESLGDQRDGDA